jgi:hypothetical protein
MLRVMTISVMLLAGTGATLPAQDALPVKNLRLDGHVAGVFDHRVLMEISEASREEDLNGDGDTVDLVWHVHDLEKGETRNPGIASLHPHGGTPPPLTPPEYLHSGRWLALAVEGSFWHLHDLDTGETTNLGAVSVWLADSWLVFSVAESYLGKDLNGDGDATDGVFHIRNLESTETTNLALAGGAWLGSWVSGNWVMLRVSEFQQGKDLNGDGDTADHVAYLHNTETGETTNLALPGTAGLPWLSGWQAGHWLALAVAESEQGEDLNGDGDAADHVVHLHNLETGRTTNLGLAGTAWLASSNSGSWLVMAVAERDHAEDLNEDGDTDDHVIHLHDLETGEKANLGLAGAPWIRTPLRGSRLVLQVSEYQQGADLNRDGDAEDDVLHLHDLETAETTNVGATAAGLLQNWLFYSLCEGFPGEDLNGDGDTNDQVVQLHDLDSDTITNLGLAGRGWFPSALAPTLVAVEVSEPQQEKDLNGDGDQRDDVLHLYDILAAQTTNLRLAASSMRLSSDWLLLRVRESAQGEDLNGDRDSTDCVVHVHSLATGETTNLGLAGWGWLGESPSGVWAVVEALEQEQGDDLNDDGDTVDSILHTARLAPAPRFSRGDADGSKTIDLSDGISVLNYLFLGGPAPGCLDAADADDGGSLDISDAIYVLDFLFLGGPPPEEPFGACGVDPTPDDLACETFEPCG